MSDTHSTIYPLVVSIFRRWQRDGKPRTTAWNDLRLYTLTHCENAAFRQEMEQALNEVYGEEDA